MRVPTALTRPLCGALWAALALALVPGSAVGQQTAVQNAESKTASRGIVTHSLYGGYLAARNARTHNDLSAAADYLKRALARDPSNEALLKQAFMVEAADGKMERAAELGEQLLKLEPGYRWARIFLGVRAFKSGLLDQAEAHFRAAGTVPVGELTGVLARAWIKVAANDTKSALELIEGLKAQDSAQYFYMLSKALIADIAGDKPAARAAFERLVELDPKGFRAASALVAHLVKAGDAEAAKRALQRYVSLTQGGSSPLVRALQADLAAGKELPLLAATAADGMAEVFYSLGEQLAAEGGLDFGAMYIQLALSLRPGYDNAQIMLASVQEAMRRFDVANETFARVSRTSPLGSGIKIRQAMNLNRLEKVDDAKAMLDSLIAEDPTDLRALSAAGDLMRAHKRYAEAVEYYSRAIKLIERPAKQHSNYFYHRGSSNERLKNWPAAEADLVKALELNPEDPLILNYLGYSWVDQNKNLKQGLAYITKAVRLKKDDGYLVDSLGWAYYRLGDFKEAVKHLERATELTPQDPTINDHYGDALWRAGRELEARFQWQQALSLKPEPEDVDKIKDKLVNGLPPLKVEPAPPPAAKRKETRRPLASPRRAAKVDRPAVQ